MSSPVEQVNIISRCNPDAETLRPGVELAAPLINSEYLCSSSLVDYLIRSDNKPLLTVEAQLRTDKQQLVGFAAARPQTIGSIESFQIDTIAVAATHQRRRIGRLMLENLEVRIARHKSTAIVTDALATGRDFFRANGYDDHRGKTTSMNLRKQLPNPVANES